MVMFDFRNSSARIKYFAVPFLALSILLFWNQWRVSSPDTAVNTAREYLEGRFPGAQWEVGKRTLVGKGLGKKWRLEFSSLQKDGRSIQANLLVDRWVPERIVGRFVLALGPPQIVDGEWNKPTFLENLSSKVSREGFLSIGALLLALQIFWLYRMHGRGGFQKADGVLLAFLGAGLLLVFSILEVHPGFMLAYALIFVFLGQVAGFPRGEENGPGKK